ILRGRAPCDVRARRLPAAGVQELPAGAGRVQPMAPLPILGFQLLLISLCSSAAVGVKSFTVWSDPIFLHRGEVHNSWVSPKGLPAEITRKFANRTMNLRMMQLDIVRVDNRTGEETVLPLYEAYNHHHALLIGPSESLWQVYNYSKMSPGLGPHSSSGHSGHGGCMMRGPAVRDLLGEVSRHVAKPLSRLAVFGGASGAEFRGTSTAIPAPYAYRVQYPVESFMVLMHFINVRGFSPKAKLWECPCTKARNINLTNNTIDGRLLLPFRCSEQLLRERNTACSLATYQGGYRCCDNGVYLTEEPPPPAPPDQIQAKFTFEYLEDDDVAPESVRPLTSPGCCDATADLEARHFGNVEYDVAQCQPGVAPELCVHEASSVQHFDMPTNESGHDEPVDPDEEFELIQAWGHQHVGALGMELYRDASSELLCRT
ncbi:unnamed protein product, partial [Prorocentrum cordatum]